METLVPTTGGMGVWTPAVLEDEAAAADEQVLVLVNDGGGSRTVLAEDVRDGLWRLHDASHVLQVACRVQNRGIGSAGPSKGQVAPTAGGPGGGGHQVRRRPGAGTPPANNLFR